MTSESVGVLVYSKIHKRRKNIGSSHVPHESAVCPVLLSGPQRDQVYERHDLDQTEAESQSPSTDIRATSIVSTFAIPTVPSALQRADFTQFRLDSLEVEVSNSIVVRRDAMRSKDAMEEWTNPWRWNQYPMRTAVTNSRSSIGHCSILR